MAEHGQARTANAAASATIGERIEREVGAWEGVVVRPHRFGGVEFTVGRREIGHLHGSRLADIPFPVAIREQLVALAGKRVIYGFRGDVMGKL